MKKMRRLIPAIAMLLVSAVMLSTASFAWFTIGTQATADGMTVTASSASTLLIVDEAAVVGTVAQAFGGADNTITFDSITAGIKPATAADGDHESDVYLMAPINTNIKTEDAAGVDHLTGAYNGEYRALTSADEGEFYIEYVAYIAAAGAAMENYDLLVGVDFATIALDVYNATTIDFLVKSSSKNTDAPELVATRNALTGDALGDNALNLGTYDIPVAPTEEITDGDYITVIMRVYVDGALEDADKEGYTYVRNSQIDLTGAGFTFNVDFQAKAAASSGT